MNTEIRKENVKLKKNIVLIPVSQNSLHRQFLKGNREFDIHLLIFDDSYKNSVMTVNLLHVCMGIRWTWFTNI